ncbi:MAG TPA: hypothetical protein VHL57_03340 [Flavobacteriales bacterium]|jgi:hypothetical protein|nr:hypothetical protein [Flavobacteriales bacterium]
MRNTDRYRAILGGITLLSGLLAAACIAVGAIAVEGDFAAFSDPVRTLMHAHNHVAAYWFNILDLFGYYLLLLPLLFHLHQLYKYRSPWVPLLTFSGAAYVLVGAIGAAILAATWPALMQDHLVAAVADQHAISTAFETITLAVTKGLWNILEVLFAATWWMGMGLLLRSASPALGWLTFATGISTLLDAIGNLFDLPLVAEIGLNLYLVLGIIWPIAMGIWLLRGGAQHRSAAQLDTRDDLTTSSIDHP